MYAPFSELPTKLDIFGNPKRFGGCGEPPLPGASSVSTLPSRQPSFASSDEKEPELLLPASVAPRSGRVGISEAARTKREAYLRYRQELAEQVAQQKALARRRIEEEARLEALDDARIAQQRREMAERERNQPSDRHSAHPSSFDGRAQSTPAMAIGSLMRSPPPRSQSVGVVAHSASAAAATASVAPGSLSRGLSNGLGDSDATGSYLHRRAQQTRANSEESNNFSTNHLTMGASSTLVSQQPSLVGMVSERQLQALLQSVERRLEVDMRDLESRIRKEMESEMKKTVEQETRSMIRTIAEQNAELDRLRGQVEAERQRNEGWMRQVVRLQQGLTHTALKQSRKVDELAEEFFRWKLLVRGLVDASQPLSERQQRRLPATSSSVPAGAVSARVLEDTLPTQSTLRSGRESSRSMSVSVQRGREQTTSLQIPPLQLSVLSKRKQNDENRDERSSLMVMNMKNDPMPALKDQNEIGYPRVLQSDSQLVSCSESDAESDHDGNSQQQSYDERHKDHNEHRVIHHLTDQKSDSVAHTRGANVPNGSLVIDNESDRKDNESVRSQHSDEGDELVMMLEEQDDDEDDGDVDDAHGGDIVAKMMPVDENNDDDNEEEADFDDLLESMQMGHQNDGRSHSVIKYGPIHQQMTPDGRLNVVVTKDITKNDDDDDDDDDTSDFPQFSEHSSDSEVELLCRIQQETARVAKMRLA